MGNLFKDVSGAKAMAKAKAKPTPSTSCGGYLMVCDKGESKLLDNPECKISEEYLDFTNILKLINANTTNIEGSKIKTISDPDGDGFYDIIMVDGTRVATAIPVDIDVPAGTHLHYNKTDPDVGIIFNVVNEDESPSVHDDVIIPLKDLLTITSPRGRGYTSKDILRHHNNSIDSSDWYHLKIPKFNLGAHMFHINVRGYSYGTGVPIDLNFVGYSKHGDILGEKASRLHSTRAQIQLGMYMSSDGALVLKFKPSNTYYTTFTVDSMYVGNGLFLEEGDIKLYIQADNL